MKHAKTIITLLLVLIIISIAAGYTAGFFVYNKYKEETAQMEKQAQTKFKDIDSGLKELYVTLQNGMDKNNIERKRLLSNIEGMKDDLRDWKKGYRASISELKKTIEDLRVERLTRIVEDMQDDINGFKVRMQDLDLKMDEVRKEAGSSGMHPDNIDLGRISIKKR